MQGPDPGVRQRGGDLGYSGPLPSVIGTPVGHRGREGRTPRADYRQTPVIDEAGEFLDLRSSLTCSLYEENRHNTL